jgi:RNA-binding protein YhbY
MYLSLLWFISFFALYAGFKTPLISPFSFYVSQLRMADEHISTWGWSNPKYSPEQLEEWWRAEARSLITIGSKGVQESHVNSLTELLSQHDRVKVKLASDRLDATAAANMLVSSSSIDRLGELLVSRKRGLLFGRIGADLLPKEKNYRRNLEGERVDREFRERDVN